MYVKIPGYVEKPTDSVNVKDIQIHCCQTIGMIISFWKFEKLINTSSRASLIIGNTNTLYLLAGIQLLYPLCLQYSSNINIFNNVIWTNTYYQWLVKNNANYE